MSFSFGAERVSTPGKPVSYKAARRGREGSRGYTPAIQKKVQILSANPRPNSAQEQRDSEDAVVGLEPADPPVRRASFDLVFRSASHTGRMHV